MEVALSYGINYLSFVAHLISDYLSTENLIMISLSLGFLTAITKFVGKLIQYSFFASSILTLLVLFIVPLSNDSNQKDTHTQISLEAMSGKLIALEEYSRELLFNLGKSLRDQTFEG